MRGSLESGISMGGPYTDHMLGAPDVCNNCFRLIREERVDPTRSGIGREFETSLTRRDETTEIGYGPSTAVSDSKGVFCDCGVESARDRLWSYTEPDRERFKELLQNAIRTLERKDVTAERETLATHALAAWTAGHNVDGAIEIGLDAAIATA
jgi:hypothetical protein